MNIRVLQWLLKNQSTLLKIVEVAKGWKKDAPYAEQWAIVDSIARLVIPLLEAEAVSAKSLVGFTPLSAPGNDTFALGAEYAALGIDWQLVSEVILPLVIAILQALAAKDR